MAVGITHAGTSSVTVASARILANNSTTTVVTVTLLDSASTALAAHTVTLTGTNSSGVTIGAASGASDVNGVVTFTVKSSVIRVGAGQCVFTARDTTDEITIAQTASVEFYGTSAANSTVATSDAHVKADNSTTATITVTLKDEAGTPAAVVGSTVTLVATNNTGVTISAASGASNGSGVVTFTIKSTTTHYGASPCVLTATDTTTGNVVVTQTVTQAFIGNAVSHATHSTCVPDSIRVEADNASVVTITVTLRTVADAVVAGHRVSLTATEATGITITTSPGLTNASGVVTFTAKSSVIYLDAASSIFTAVDLDDSVTVTQTATMEFIGPTAAQSTCVASAATCWANSADTVTITVTLKDELGVAQAGHAVALSATSNGTSVTIVGSPGVTNSSGVVTFTAHSAAIHPTGTETVFTAVDTTDSVTVTQTATVLFYGVLTANHLTRGMSLTAAYPLGGGNSTATLILTAVPSTTNIGLAAVGTISWLTISDATPDSGDTVTLTAADPGGVASGVIPFRDEQTIIASKTGYTSLTIPVTFEIGTLVGGRR